MTFDPQSSDSLAEQYQSQIKTLQGYIEYLRREISRLESFLRVNKIPYSVCEGAKVKIHPVRPEDQPDESNNKGDQTEEEPKELLSGFMNNR